MQLQTIIRRTHLYLAMFLAPWFVMYGLTSIAFNHPALFTDNSSEPVWIFRARESYSFPINENSELREVAAAILKDKNIEGSFHVQRPDRNTLIVTRFDFFHRTRLTFKIDQKTLLIEDRKVQLQNILTGMHGRGGFQQDVWLHDLWAVFVDLVAVAILVWIATGIFLWLQISSIRKWGGIVLVAGFLTFLVLVITL
jgi:hypothetical protein